MKLKKETNPKKKLRNSYFILAFAFVALTIGGLINVAYFDVVYGLILMVFASYFFGALVMLWSLKDKVIKSEKGEKQTK